MQSCVAGLIDCKDNDTRNMIERCIEQQMINATLRPTIYA